MAAIASVALLSIVGLPCRATAGAARFNMDIPPVGDAKGREVIDRFYPEFRGQGDQGPAMARVLNNLLVNLHDQLTTNVNQKLSTYNLTGFLDALAGSSASVNKTMPVDYASDASIFTLSLGAGVGVHNLNIGNVSGFPDRATKGLDNGYVPPEGAAPTASVLLGINLSPFHLPKVGPFDPSRLTVYADFATYGGTTSGVEYDFLNLGLHGQYKLVEGVSVVPGGVLRWGGVSVVSGFDYASYSVNTDAKLPTDTVTQTFNFSNKNLDAKIGGGTARLGARLKTGSVPFEASTSVQLLYLFTLYGGAGIDLNFGSASMTADSTQTFSLSDPANPSAGTLEISQPHSTVDFPTGAPSWGDLRGFGGVQLNFFAVALFAQINADTARNMAGNLGLRIFW